MEKRVTFSNTWLAAALILPQILLVFVFFYWPTGEALYWAFTLERPFGGGNEWVGLYNFDGVFNDPKYWSSVQVSILFAVAATVLSLVIAMMLALFVDRQLPGYQAYKFTFFLPYALAAPAVGLAFRFIFSPDAGFVSAINQLYPGIWNPALDGFDALLLIIFAQAWSLVDYNLLFFLIVINITDSFVNSFGIVDITTGGGPARATDLMVYKIYTDGFQGKDYSLAAAQSIVLMFMIIGLTFVQFRFIERRVHYS